MIKSNLNKKIMTKNVQKGDGVRFSYTMWDLEGKQIWESEFPMYSEIGSNALLPIVENSLIGMHIGENKRIVVNPEDGFGARDENLIIDIDKSSINGEINVGNYVTTRIKNRIVTAEVLSMTDDKVKLDLNNPLAGKGFIFEVVIVDIKLIES